jgi:1-acyl-sn-glycerol-3-phosphate acyltransferase
MRKILKVFDFLCIILIFLVVLVPPAIFVLPFNQKTRNKFINPFWKIFSRILLAFPLRTKVHIEDRRRLKNQTEGLYLVNHQSMVDIPLFSFNHQIPPIMKHEILYIPLFGLVGLVSGAITVKRKDPHSRKKTFQKAQARLLDHQPVQYYPEGTRSKTNEPKPYEDIYKTLMDFCFNSKIPVIPCSIYGTKFVLAKDGTINYGKKLGFITHEEMNPEAYSTKEEFSRACWDKVVKGFKELESKLSHAQN